MKLILASNNAHKLREFGEILSALDIEIVSQHDVGCDLEPEETGDTFEENAFIKADTIMHATGLACVADDSGLVVDALHGEPGVHSARYTGNHSDTDKQRRDFLLAKLGSEEHRAARFVSSICCRFPNGDTLRAERACEGAVAYEERGENGFGYDSIFLPEEFPGKTMAELTPEEKNSISHRGKALRAFAEELRNYNADNK